MRKLLPILFCLLLASCREKDAVQPPEFPSGTISLIIEGKSVFVYDDISCQCSFDTSGNIFRAHTDDMGDYFFLGARRYSQPLKKGDSLTANLEWAVGRSVPQERTNVSFTVDDIDEEGYVYLWSSGSIIAAVIRIF